jgi:hypothetical protein
MPCSQCQNTSIEHSGVHAPITRWGLQLVGDFVWRHQTRVLESKIVVEISYKRMYEWNECCAVKSQTMSDMALSDKLWNYETFLEVANSKIDVSCGCANFSNHPSTPNGNIDTGWRHVSNHHMMTEMFSLCLRITRFCITVLIDCFSSTEYSYQNVWKCHW